MLLSPVQTEVSMLSNLMPNNIEDFEKDDLDLFLLAAAPLNVSYQNDDTNSSESFNKNTLTATEKKATLHCSMTKLKN